MVPHFFFLSEVFTLHRSICHPGNQLTMALVLVVKTTDNKYFFYNCNINLVCRLILLLTSFCNNPPRLQKLDYLFTYTWALALE